MSNQTRTLRSAQQPHSFTLAGLRARLASRPHSKQKTPHVCEHDRLLNASEDERPERVGPRRGARTALCGLLLVGISGVALAQLWPWLRQAGSQEAPAQPGCAAWDREASEGIAKLVFDGSAAAEWKLDQAILQLRRARKHCRSGSVQAALHDYASLHRSLPFLTGSIHPHAKNGSTSGQQAIPSDP